MFFAAHQDSPSALLDRAWRRLRDQATFRGRTHCLHIEEQDGRLILEGRLPTFYLKQLLQTTLREVEGVREIDNRVEVPWPERF